MNKGRIGLLLGVVFSFVLVASVFGVLTGVTLNAPVTGENISGVYVLEASILGGESASSVTFWWFDGNAWALAGVNTSGGTSFKYLWDTSAIDVKPAQVKVNATDGSVKVTSSVAESLTIDNTLPVFTNIRNSSTFQTSAFVSWNSDELCNSSVNYGILDDWFYGSSNSSYYVLSHSVSLTGLTEGVLYYYNVSSCDFSGNCKIEGPNNFTTFSIFPEINDVSVVITNSSGFVSWDTDELANGSIEWGLTTSLSGGVIGSISNTTFHSFNITNLLNGTLYYYNITSCDLINQCSTIGPSSFTTLLDSTDPVFTGGISFDGNPTATVNEFEFVNITVSVGDNIGVDSVWAQVNLSDGSISNHSMVFVSGSGTLSDNYLASLYFNNIESGVHSVIVFAEDTSGNVVNTSEASWIVKGFFTLAGNISSPFKDFSNDDTFSVLFTITNDWNASDNYTIDVDIKNSSNHDINGTRGWEVSWNSTLISNVAVNDDAYFKVDIAVPKNASETISLIADVTSDSGRNKIRSYSIAQYKITIDLPDLRISNNRDYTSIFYDFYNYTNVSWIKAINVSEMNFTSEFSWNIENSAVTCALEKSTGLRYKGKVFKNYSFVVGGKMTNVSCFFNMSSFSAIYPGVYNLTVEITDDRSHRSSVNLETIIPGEITIDTEDRKAIKDSGIIFSGTAKYAENPDFRVIDGLVKITYSGKTCIGRTISTGAFSLNCHAVSSSGNYNVNIEVTGVFNVSSSKTISLAVSEKLIDDKPAEKLNIIPSSNEIILDKDVNFTVSVFNNLLSSADVSITAVESGSKRHFEISYENAVKSIAVGDSDVFDISLVPFDYSRPGTYDLIIKAGEFSKTVKVTIPAFDYINDSVNTNRFIEKENGKSIISIEIVNKKNARVELNVTETIPKSVASNVNEIVFNIEPVVIESDPIVMWSLDLAANSNAVLSYTVNKDVGNDVVFTIPQSVITNIKESVDDEIVADDTISNTRRIIYIALIFILAAIGVVLILFKDQLFEKKSKNYLKPSSIKEAKKKLVGKVDVVKKTLSKKKKGDFSEEPDFEFSGVSKEIFKKEDEKL